MDKLNMSLDDIIKKDRSGKKPQKARNAHHPYQRNQNNDGLRQNRMQSSERIEKSGPLTTSGKSAPLFTKASMENKDKAAPISIAQIRGLTTKSSKINTINSNTNNNNNGNSTNSSTQRQPAKKPQHITIKGEAGPCVLSVSNLDRGATASDVEQCFMKFGKITNILLFYDQYQQSTGNAEITFAAKKEALAAIDNLNNAVADGHVLSVQLKPTPSNPGTPVSGNKLKVGTSSSNGNNGTKGGSQQGEKGQSQSSNLYSDRLTRGDSRPNRARFFNTRK